MVTKKQTSSKTVISTKQIARSILMIRGERVMLDADLAKLYRVETKILL